MRLITCSPFFPSHTLHIVLHVAASLNIYAFSYLLPFREIFPYRYPPRKMSIGKKNTFFYKCQAKYLQVLSEKFSIET